MITIIFKILGDKTLHEHGEYCEKHIDLSSIVFLPSFNDPLTTLSIQNNFKQKYNGKTIKVRYSGISKIDGYNFYEFEWTREIRNEKIDDLL